MHAATPPPLSTSGSQNPPAKSAEKAKDVQVNYKGYSYIDPILSKISILQREQKHQSNRTDHLYHIKANHPCLVYNYDSTGHNFYNVLIVNLIIYSYS